MLQDLSFTCTYPEYFVRKALRRMRMLSISHLYRVSYTNTRTPVGAPLILLLPRSHTSPRIPFLVTIPSTYTEATDVAGDRDRPANNILPSHDGDMPVPSRRFSRVDASTPILKHQHQRSILHVSMSASRLNVEHTTHTSHFQAGGDAANSSCAPWSHAQASKCSRQSLAPSP